MRNKYILICTCFLLAAFLCACGTAAVKTESAAPVSVTQTETDSAASTSVTLTETPAEVSTSSSADLQKHEYAEKTCKLHEPCDFVYILPKCEETEEGKTVYRFEIKISADTRERFISCQEMLNERLGLETAVFILTESYMDRADSGEQAAFNLVSSVASWRQVLTTLQLMEGADANYGFLYAKANQIAEELEWETDLCEAVSGEELKQCFRQDPGRLNLFYPCYLSPYSTEKQILCAKALSKQVLSETRAEDEEQFLTGLAETAAGWGIDFAPSYLRCISGGKSCPLIIRTRWVEECLTTEYYRDATYLKLESDGYEIPNELDWEKNMSELIRLREKTDEAIAAVREMFHFEKEGLADVYYRQDDGGWNYYINGQKKIYVTCAWSILHEYIHYLHFHSVRQPYYVDSWIYEALATYLGWEMIEDAHERLDEAVLNEKNPVSPEEYYLNRFYRLLSENGTRPRDWLYSKKTAGENYWAFYSIGAYLAERFPEELFCQLMVSPENAEQLTGETMEQIIADWSAFVETKIP